MTPPLRAECRELKPVVGSKRSDDFRGNDLLIDAGQWDLKYNQFAFLKGIGHESSQATLAQIARPTLQA
jgi:hypothetical protein